MSFAHLLISMLILLIFSYRLQRLLKCMLHHEILCTQENDVKWNFSDRTHDLCNNKLKKQYRYIDIKYNLDYIKKNPQTMERHTYPPHTINESFGRIFIVMVTEEFFLLFGLLIILVCFLVFCCVCWLSIYASQLHIHPSLSCLLHWNTSPLPLTQRLDVSVESTGETLGWKGAVLLGLGIDSCSYSHGRLVGHPGTLTSREFQPHSHQGLTFYPSSPEAHASGNFHTIHGAKAASLQTKFGSPLWEVEASSKFVSPLGSLPQPYC